jgi:rubrerythrin
LPGRGSGGEAVPARDRDDDRTVSGIVKGRHRVENPTRRRLLAAGFAGTTLGLLGSRAASASPDTTSPPEDEGSTAPTASSTTEPPQQPTQDDVPMLQFAHALELAARDLYQAALDAGAEEEALPAIRDNHQAYADVLKGLLGTAGDQEPDDGVYSQFERGFASSDVAAIASAGYELESAAIATHTQLIGELQGLDGAQLLASILVVEARHAAVLADIAGRGDDFDALFENDAQPLSASPSIGG